MANEIESRVVEMRFENGQFESNVDHSMKTLDKLENKLAMTNGTEGFERITSAAKKCDMSTLTAALTQVSNGFSVMGVAAVTTIANITTKLENLGANIFSSLFIQPITQGWVKYGKQVQSAQVIMNNTGESLERVKGTLENLNEYADETIYSFDQMTYAIGKFAAAGVGLDESAEAIKGLSNAAALVGATNQQLYSAYYNLSQSMQMGYLKLIDWKSIANSTIGTKTMRKEFVKTAIEMGKFTENSVQAKKALSDFEGSLNSKWLTTDVIVKTLQKYQDETSELGKAATAAATEMKSFSQMWDVLVEQMQTGWSQTWTFIIGDLAKAKTFWTNIGNRIQGILQAISNATRDVAERWSNLGGNRVLLEGICNVLNAIRVVLNVIFKVLDRTFNITGRKLYDLTVKFKEFAESLILSEDAAAGLEKVLSVLIKPFSFLYKLIKVVFALLGATISSIVTIGSALLELIANINQYPELLEAIFGKNYKQNLENVKQLFINIRNVIATLISIVFRTALNVIPVLLIAIKSVITVMEIILSVVGAVFKTLAGSDLSFLEELINSITLVSYSFLKVISKIPEVFSKAFGGKGSELLTKLLKIFVSVVSIISRIITLSFDIISELLPYLEPLLEKVGDLLYTIANAVLVFLESIDDDTVKAFNEVLAFTITILTKLVQAITVAITNISSVIGSISEVVVGGASKMLNAGRSLISSFAKGISFGSKEVREAAEEAGDLAEEGFRDSTEVGSPSPKFIGMGTWVSKSVGMGIKKGGKDVTSSIESLGQNIQRETIESLEEVNNYISNSNSLTGVNDNVVQGFKDASTSISSSTDMIDDSIDEVATSSETLADRLSTTTNSMERNIVLFTDSLTNSMERMTKAISDFFNSITDETQKRLLAAFLGGTAIVGLFTVLGILVVRLTSSARSMSRTIGRAGETFEGLGLTFRNFSTSFQNLVHDGFTFRSLRGQYESKAQIFLRIATGISLMVASTALLLNSATKINVQRDWPSLLAVFGIMSSIIGLSIVLFNVMNNMSSKMSDNRTANSMTVLSIALRRIMFSFALIMLTLKLLDNVLIDWSVIATVASIGGFVIALTSILAYLEKSVTGKGNNITANRLTMISRLGRIIAVVILGMSKIMLAMKLLDGVQIGWQVIGVLTSVGGAIIAVLSLIPFLLKAVNGQRNITTKINSMALMIVAVTSALSIAAISLKLIDNISIKESTVDTLNIMYAVMLGFSLLGVLASRIIKDIKSLLSASGLLVSAAIAIAVLAHSVTFLNGITIHPGAVDAMIKFMTGMGIVAALAAAIGKGTTYYGLIGAAIIIAIGGAIRLCAESIKVAGQTKWDVVADGLKKIMDILTENKNGATVGFIFAIIGLSIAFALIAPAIILLAVGATIFAAAFYLATSAVKALSEAIINIADAFKEISDSFVAMVDSLVRAADMLSENAGRIDKTRTVLLKLSLCCVLVGASLYVLSAGINAVSRTVQKFANATLETSVSMNLLAFALKTVASSADDIDTFFDSLTSNLTAIISVLLVLTNYKGALLAFGAALLMAGGGIALVINSIANLGKSLLWIAGGLLALLGVIKLIEYVMKDELAVIIDFVTSKFAALKEIFGGNSYLALGAVMAGIVAILGGLIVAGIALNVFGQGLKSVGKGLTKIGLSLIWVARGLNSLKKAIIDLNQEDASQTVKTLISLGFGLMVFSAQVGLVAPLILIAAPAVALLGLAFKSLTFGMEGVNDLLGDGSLAKGLRELAKSILYFLIAMGIFLAAAYPLTAFIKLLNDVIDCLVNMEERVISISETFEEFMFNIYSGITFLSTGISEGIDRITESIYNATAQMVYGSTNIASSLEIISASAVTVADNICAAAERICEAIISIKNALSDVASVGGVGSLNIFGNSEGTGSGITNTIKSGLSGMENVGEWVTNSLATGIQNGKSFLASVCNSIATNGVEETIRNALQVHSPSPLFQSIGNWVSKSLGIGIVEESDEAGEASESVFTKVYNGFNKLTGGKFQGVIDKVKSNFSGVADAIDKIKSGDIASVVKGIFPSLDGLSDIFGDLQNTFTEALNIDTSSFTDAMGSMSSSATETKGTIETLTDTVKNQMKMFEKFDDATDISAQELLSNMESQLNGITNWANGIETLGLRGMSAELIQYLAEMGPEGYRYVEAFLDMTEEEFAKANDYYAQSLVLPQNSVATVIRGYEAAGAEIIASVASGITGGSSSASKAVEEVGEVVKDKMHDEAAAVNDLVEDYTDESFIACIAEAARHTANLTPPEKRGLELLQECLAEGFTPAPDILARAWTAAIKAAPAEVLKYLSGTNQTWRSAFDEASMSLINDTAKYTVQGLNAILTGSELKEYVKKTGREVAYYLVEGYDEYTMTHSPSRLFMKKGEYAAEGLVLGLQGSIGYIKDAGEQIGEEAELSLSKSLEGIANIFTDDIDTTPTITPVLDLTDIEAGTAKLSDMLSNSTATVHTTGIAALSDSIKGDPIDSLAKVMNDANAKYNADLLKALSGSDKNVTVNVVLEGDAEGVFKLVERQNILATKATGVSPLMTMYNNGISARKHATI